MLEGVIAPVLDRFLGQYIVDLPREQLRVGLWSGVLRLENVRLKPDAFDALKLPFAVREGTIALLELKIAWKTWLLRAHPIVVTLDGIAVTASPRAEDEWAAEPAAKRALALKRAALAVAAELAAQKRRGGADVADAAGGSMLAAMVPTVLDRLSVKVGAVHVRFADMPRLADDEDVAAFGFRIDSMLIATSKTRRKPFSAGDETQATSPTTSGRRDSRDERDYEFFDARGTSDETPPGSPNGLSTNQKGFARKRRQRMLSSVRSILNAVTPMSSAKKRIDVTGLRVYSRAKQTDQNDSPLEWYPAPRALGAVDKLGAPTDPNWRANYDDKIDPDDVVLGAETLTCSLTVTARERSRPAGTSASTTNSVPSPGFDVRFEVLSALEVNIRPSQMRSAIRFADASTVWGLRNKHGSLRPAQGISGAGNRKKNYRAWWRYAGRAVIQEIKSSPSLGDTATAVPTEDAGRAVTLGRYATLYERKLRVAVSDVSSQTSSPASSAFDDSFDQDLFFECDEDPSTLQGDALELFAIETQLTLEELLEARGKAEYAAYADEDESDEDDADSFLDAEEFDETGGDFYSDSGLAKKNKNGLFSRAVGALYKRGAGFAGTSLGYASRRSVTRGADGGSSYAPPNGVAGETSAGSSRDEDTKTNVNLPGAKFAVEAKSFTIAFRKETDCETSKRVSSSSTSTAFTLELRGIRCEMDVPGGPALRCEIRDVEGWLPKGSDGDAPRLPVVWRRRDANANENARSKTRSVLRFTQLASSPLGTQPPLDIDVAPLCVMAHPALATALAPFAREVKHTHRALVLNATRRLPGNSPRTRIARAAVSIEQQLTAQPWRLSMHSPVFFLPHHLAPREAYAAAVEVTHVAVEYTAGNGVVLTPENTDALARAATRLAQRGVAGASMNAALLALENAATSHLAAMTFGGTRVLLPTLDRDAHGSGTTKWTSVVEDWGGSVLYAAVSSSVGGPAAASRASARFAPLCVCATPETVVSLGEAVHAASWFNETATDSMETVATETNSMEPTAPPETDASDFEVSCGEISVTLVTGEAPRREKNKRASRRELTTSGGVTFHGELRGVEARFCASRNRDSRVDFVVHGVAARRGVETVVRVVAPAASASDAQGDDPKLFARLEIETTGAPGTTRALLRACGVEIVAGDTLVSDLGTLAVSLADAKTAMSVSETTRVTKSKPSSRASVVGGVDDAATTALTLFGAGGSSRDALCVFPGGAPCGTDFPGGCATEASLARDTFWAALSLDEHERFVRSASPAFARVKVANEDANKNANTFAFASRSPAKIVLALDDPGPSATAVASMEIGCVDLCATLRGSDGVTDAEAPENRRGVHLDVAFVNVRAFGETSAARSTRVAVLDFGVRAACDFSVDKAYVPVTPPNLDVRVSRFRVGAHVDVVKGISHWVDLASSRFGMRTLGTTLEQGASPNEPSPSAEKTPSLSSFGKTSVVVDETSVFVPGDVSSTSGGDGGFLFVLSIAALETRVPRNDASAVTNAPLISVRLAGARLYATRREHDSCASALTDHALVTSCPIIFDIDSMRAEQQACADGKTFVVDIPLVRLVVTPLVVTAAVQAAARFAAVVSVGEVEKFEDAKSEETSPKFNLGWSGALDVTIGRASLLAQSSEKRVGGYGDRTDEVAALATASSLRFAARFGDADTPEGKTKTKQIASVEMSIESVQVLDVSGTFAGDAERMAAGDLIGDGAPDVSGVLLAWIGSTGETKRSVVAARSEGEVFFEFVPERTAVTIDLDGGGFVLDVAALDRVKALAGVLVESAVLVDALESSTVDEKARSTSTERRKSVTFADRDKKRAAKQTEARVAFTSGEWQMTLPLTSPTTDTDGGRACFLLRFDTQADVSFTADITRDCVSGETLFALNRARFETRAERVALAVRSTKTLDKNKNAQNVPGPDSKSPVLDDTVPVFEMRGFGAQARSEGGAWHDGLAVDVAVRDVTLVVSRRRSAWIAQAGRVVEKFLTTLSSKVSSKSTPPSPCKPLSVQQPSFFTTAPNVSVSVSCDVLGLLVAQDTVNEGEEGQANTGDSLLEGAAFGAHGGCTFDAAKRTLQIVAETRVVLDALDHEKGAWECVVEPWRLRVTADCGFSFKDGSASKIYTKVEGVNALEITLGEASAATVAAAARALSGAETAFPGTSARNARTYWLHNATHVAVTYTLPFADGATDVGGTVSPGERVAIHFPGTETRAAPRYARVQKIEPCTRPAPAPPRARRRAVVVTFQNGFPPTAPIVLDAFGAQTLAGIGERGEVVVAEVRRAVDEDDENENAGSRVAGHAAARIELLLRSDLAFHNATLSPIELDFGFDHTGADCVRVPPGSRLWLPASRAAGDTPRARWRPAARTDADANCLFKWSEPISLRAIAEGRMEAGSQESLVSLGSSVSREGSHASQNGCARTITEASFKASAPTVSSVTAVDNKGASTPFACVLSGRRDANRVAAVVTLAPALIVTNALPVPVTVSFSSPVSTSSQSATIIAPGSTAALHDAFLGPHSRITVHARPHGFTHCESVAVPATSGAPGELAFEAFREVFAVTHTFGDPKGKMGLPKVSPVSVRVRVTVDPYGARRVTVSAPAAVLNETETPLVILALLDPVADPVELESTLARLGMGAHEEAPERLAVAGEGDCFVPPASFANQTNTDVTGATRSPVSKRGAPSREISNPDFSPEGMSRLRFPEADGASPTTPSSPPTADVKPSSHRAVSPLIPSVDVSVASPPKTEALGSRSSQSQSSQSTSPAPEKPAPGVAMFGRSESAANNRDPAFTLVRIRAASSNWWSSAARLTVGDAPCVLRLPAGSEVQNPTNPKNRKHNKWTVCDEYLCGLKPVEFAAGCVGTRGTIIVKPRFTVRSQNLADALFVRQPGCESTKTVPPGGEVAVTRWSNAENTACGSHPTRVGNRDSDRLLVFRPACQGVWSWSSPVAVDSVGVTHVCVSARSSSPTRFRVYRVAVSPSKDTHFRAASGGFAVDVSELGPREAVNFAPPAVATSASLRSPSPRGVKQGRAESGMGRSAWSDNKFVPHHGSRFQTLAHAIAFAGSVVGKAKAKTQTQTPPAVVRLELILKSVGMSLVSNHETGNGETGGELLYARASAICIGVTAKGERVERLREAEAAVTVGAVRVDLQTEDTTKRPTVFAIGDANGSVHALVMKTTLGFETAVGQNSAGVGSWRARSVSVDPAPMVIDLREVFGTAVPRVVANAASSFAALGVSNVPPVNVPSPVPPVPVPTVSSQIGFQSLRIARIDAVVSFAALPFLPQGVRSAGAVAGARVTLRGFSLPSRDLTKARNGNTQFGNRLFAPATVARLAQRHYLAESAAQVVRLVASTQLLGDPARLAGELTASLRELWNSPLGLNSLSAFSKRTASAVAAWAKTVLTHAAQVTREMEERFESAKRKRLERLRGRRIADHDDDDAQGMAMTASDMSLATKNSDQIPTPTRATVPTPAAPTREEVGLLAGVVAGVLRAAGHLVEGPLQGAELAGLPGLVEGAAEGVFGAACATASAALALATTMVDKLGTYGDQAEELENSGGDEGNENGFSVGARDAPPRLRTPRPPPTSRLEPWRPFHDDETANDT